MRATASGTQLVTSRSPTSTSPERTSTIPTRLFKSVLLPEPFGPTIETTSPGSTSIDTAWMIGLPP